MKKTKLIFIIFASIILFVIGIVSSAFIGGTCRYKYKNSNDDLSSWMNYIKDDTKLNEIIIPGTHDSGTYNMIYAAETQTLTIHEQLMLGVRYFDIRITKEKDEYVIYHSFITGTKAIPILEEFKNYISSFQTETLILDFQHFGDGIKDEVFNLVNTYLLDYAIKNDTSLSDLEFIDSLTINDVRGKVIILFGEGLKHTDNNYIFYRNNDGCSEKNASLNSMYVTEYNASSSAYYIETYIPLYIQNIKDKITNEGHKGLFVLQCQLTDAKLIFGPWSREKQHEKNISEYISSLHTNDDFNYINIIMRDFINQEKTTEIIKLNYYKDIIKEDLEDLFTNSFKVI